MNTQLRSRFLPLAALGSLLLPALLPCGGCAPRTVVLVRDARETALAGRTLGGYTKEVPGSYGAVTVPTRVSDVRTADSVSVHTVGAYPDPADPRLLHEPHRVYRLDQRARWRLAPAADVDPVRRGPVAALRRAEYAPGATRGEAGREIMASRRAIQSAATAVADVNRQQLEMAAGVKDATGTLVRNQGRLLEIHQALAGRVEKLETARARDAAAAPRVPLSGPPGGGGPLAGGVPAAAPSPTPALTNPPTVGPAAPLPSPPAPGVY